MLRLLLASVACLPRQLGLRAFGAIGLLADALLRNPRQQIMHNTSLIFPAWTKRERKCFARNVFRHMGRNGFDFVRIPGYSEETIRKLVTIRGLEHLERERRLDRGVLCIGAHLGCWELIPFRLRAEGWKMAVVYRSLRDPDLNSYVLARRARWGIETHDRDTGGRGMLRSLKRGALLGVLIDQQTRVDSVWVPFLGREALTPSGPARLALRIGIPMVPMTITMRPDGNHVLQIGPKIAMRMASPGADEGEYEELIRENTRRCNDALGRMILASKEQWVWFHPRWREGQELSSGSGMDIAYP